MTRHVSTEPRVSPGQTGISVCVLRMSAGGNRSGSQIVSIPGLTFGLFTEISTTDVHMASIMHSGRIGQNGAIQNILLCLSYREVGLAFEGREHSGIEDARNTAKLIWKMVQSGCLLNITATRDENSLPMANTAHR